MTAPASDRARLELEVDVRLPLDRFDLRTAFTTAGPVTGVFGPSGSGKTSLLRVIAGLSREAAGTIRLGEETWLAMSPSGGRRLPPEERDVGYVPQDGLLFPHWDVRRNLLAGSARARRRGLDPEAGLASVVERMELGGLLNRSVESLSGGERQRVALGRALCSGPRLLLLDEPLAALDLPLRRRLLPFLARVCRDAAVPALLVSHDPVEIQALCDEVIALEEGRVVARGTPYDVLTDPAVLGTVSEVGAGGGFENVLPGVLVGGEAPEGTRRVRLGQGGAQGGVRGVELIVLAPEGRPEHQRGAEVLVGIRADDILIAREEPRGLSARNVLPGTVRAVRTVGAASLVEVALGEGIPPVAVRVTESRPAELGLAPGRAAYLILKAAGCRLYGTGGASPSSF